jgi:GNAT superfamily N-acetyltransferase
LLKDYEKKRTPLFENLKHDFWLSEQLECSAFHLSDFKHFSEDNFPEGNYFIDAKVKIEDRLHLKNLIELGFELIETNIQLKRPPQYLNIPSPTCRFAVPKDRTQIETIAMSSFTKSRFHVDPKISLSKANLIKKNWVSNFFNGVRGKWLVVSEVDNEVFGFTQILETSSTEIIIDLIAVDEKKRGQGIGQQMISYANKNCGNSNVVIKVGTQLINADSIRFYERLGFLFDSASDVYHCHSK